MKKKNESIQSLKSYLDNLKYNKKGGENKIKIKQLLGILTVIPSDSLQVLTYKGNNCHD